MMTRVLIVEPCDENRADLVDLLCELPGIEVIDAVADRRECEATLFGDPIDVIVAGELLASDLVAIERIAANLGCTVIEVMDTDVVAELRRLVRLGDRPREFRDLVARSRAIVRDRDTTEASTSALALRLQTRGPRQIRGAQSVDLREWLPRFADELLPVVPSYINVVAIVGGDDQLVVQCIPALLEDLVQELVLRACAQLPLGGTVWITAASGANGEVKLDVLENGRGQVLDLVLRSPARTMS